MTFNDWARRHPQAAAELMATLAPAMQVPDGPATSDEAIVQQELRFKISRAGSLSWRNNVGATPAKIPACCPKCQLRFNIDQRPIRYGLCNDSQRLNEQFKSSDLILAIPRKITPEMVGTTIAQFGSVEVKRPGWKYTGKGREVQQASWGALIERIGGYFRFSTGEIDL